jgi:cytochrome oxidase assembly protein ShyY1
MTAHDDLPEVFPPTLREVMLRPRWLAMLALCLVVAGVFAWLGQWQLGRALDTVPADTGQTEKVVSIQDVVRPGEYLNAPLVGQKVRAAGGFVPGDFLVVSRRLNDGVEGFWVTGQFRVAGPGSPTSLAVAVGWAPTLDAAKRAASALNAAASTLTTVQGRLISDEGPAVPPRDDPFALTTMSPAALLSRWHDTAGLDVYRPYLTSDRAPAVNGLVTISSPAPEGAAGLNWLNLFYAAEWAVFAGFAFYLWYRLAKDAWEKEVEELEQSDLA